MSGYQSGGKAACRVGSRTQVYHNTCERTAGGLRKSDLKYNKNGKIVSKRASSSAKKQNNLGVFLVDKNSSKFELRPKRRSSAYNKLKNEGKTSKRRSSKSKSKRRKSRSKSKRKSKKSKTKRRKSKRSSKKKEEDSTWYEQLFTK